MHHKTNGIYEFDLKVGLVLLMILLCLILSGCDCKSEEEGGTRSDVKTLICK